MRKKITLINPPVADYSALDIGLTYLATYVNERTHHHASIIDLVFHRGDWPRYLAAQLREARPDYVGLAVNKLQIPIIAPVITFVRRQLGYTVIIGGHQTSLDPEGTLQAVGADYACTGDGETSLMSFLKSEEQGESGQRIWRGHFVANLDNLPTPDYTLWKDLKLYHYFLNGHYVQGSRGCMFSCSFCDARGIARAVPGRYYRVMSPEVYVDQLGEIFDRCRPPLFVCFDPVFTADADWLDAFAEIYRDRVQVVPLSVFARFDQLDERRIKALARANCRVVRAGIEAGDEWIRNHVYQKRVSNQQILQMAALLKRYGIALTAYTILGGPYESHRTLRASIDLACQVGAERAVFFIWKCLTKEGEEQMRQCGGVLHTERSDDITFGAVADLPGLSARRVEWYQREAYALTFSKRLFRLVREQRMGYAKRLVEYVARGLSYGLDLKYLLAYFQVYGGPNAIS